MLSRLKNFFQFPAIRRVAWHVRRVRGKVDGGFFKPLLAALFAIMFVASLVVWIFETDRSPNQLGKAIYWTSTTVLGQGDASLAAGPVGWVIGWLLGLFGVAIVATMTGVLVGFVIDFLLKEGQGMGAAGYTDHIVVCGWNPTARDLIEELSADESAPRIVLIHDAEHNPADSLAYYVRGDATTEEDLKRACIEHARAAIICPADSSNEADLHSILTILAVESLAPQVRTVAEVNNPVHVPHFRRANADELLVTSRLTSRLLARSALYPGLTELVTDIVGGRSNSDEPQLYRVALPEAGIGKSIIELATMMRADHHATVLAVNRNGQTVANPPHGFRMQPGDDLVVLAYNLGDLTAIEEVELVRSDPSTISFAADAAPATA
ncbi:MAG TPA: NAD-binding protein [Acidimicrobiia bacterium]|nr:NAD-binding protein [Acidimicrobiia bacterium]